MQEVAAAYTAETGIDVQIETLAAHNNVLTSFFFILFPSLS